MLVFPKNSSAAIFFGVTYIFIYLTYLCFISLLYLDLYVLGDDALIS